MFSNNLSNNNEELYTNSFNNDMLLTDDESTNDLLFNKISNEAPDSMDHSGLYNLSSQPNANYINTTFHSNYIAPIIGTKYIYF